jgi:hypothetical protein
MKALISGVRCHIPARLELQTPSHLFSLCCEQRTFKRSLCSDAAHALLATHFYLVLVCRRSLAGAILSGNQTRFGRNGCFC